MPIEFNNAQGIPPPTPPVTGDVRSRYSVFTGPLSPALESLGHRDTTEPRPLHTRQIEQGEAPAEGAIKQLRATPENPPA